MPLGTARITRLAVALCGLALLSVLGGCTAFVPSKPASPSAAAPQQLTPTNAWLYPLETITGGLVGNDFVGNANQHLKRPVAVAVRDHQLYIVDAGAEMLYLYDDLTKRMSILKDLRGVVSGEVPDIYVAADRSYYLADADGHQVLRFDRYGQLVQTFKDSLNLARPVAVSVDEATGDVYVADGLFDHVLVFNSAGDLWRMIGDRGLEDGEFLNITAMTLGPDGVYVTARIGKRGQVLDKNSGKFLYAFDDDTVVFPKGIAVDKLDDRAYVSDFFDNSIKIFKHGHLLATVGGTGASPGRFKGIRGVTLESGFLYVADSLNGRIQVFKITAGTPSAEKASSK
jgi:DNA-binding beta-propeller fold protein YncE